MLVLISLLESEILDLIFAFLGQFIETFGHLACNFFLEKLLIKPNVFIHFLLKDLFSKLLFWHEFQIKQVFKTTQEVGFRAPDFDHLDVV